LTRLAQAQAALAAQSAKIYFDVSPLLEAQWTGIPIVAAGLAGALLAAMPERLHFFLGTALVDQAVVADSLARRGGAFLLRADICGRARVSPLNLLDRDSGPTIGIFPSVKPIRRAFDVECSVFHDLSTLVLPYFHIKGNVDHHMEALLADIASNDLMVAVSEATAADLTAYLGVDPARIVVAHNGVSWPDDYGVNAANALAPLGAEPYVLILGTREPRKNVMLVFDMLAATPELLQANRFVFAGKMGWLEEQHALPKSLEPARDSGRILFTGFVSDATKYRLLAGAQATLYPSLFEGFGLPVLESLSAGTPCIASWSSSIPEVGGALCSYFDPLSAADMKRAVLEMLDRRRRESDRLTQACRAQAATFSWENAAGAILERLAAILPPRA
jgi:glycosyltransferase involved in cell wall biosynthesis